MGAVSLELRAGPRPRRMSLFMAPVATNLPAGGYRLADAAGSVAAQVEEGWLLAVLPALAAGEQRSMRLERAEQRDLAVAEERGDHVVVTVAGTALGELLLAEGTKPYLHPLRLPDGQCLTRRVPPDREAGDVSDHPHHKGMWVGHGDVDGVDFWSDNPRNLGRELVRAVRCHSGPVAAHVELLLDWVGPDDRVALHERRAYRFWCAGADARIIDVVSTYTPPEGRAVRFGDTKEGALCCIRLAAGMEGNRGGLITTSAGARTEAEAWGSAASWCDYSGQPLQADGRSRGRTVGVAIFDHPENPLHPTRWHVRDYGLFTANPFALHDYLPGRGLRGDYVVPAGGSATFRYRVYAHVGGAAEADVAGRYADWAWPVQASLS
jgi:hypothetical protein